MHKILLGLGLLALSVAVVVAGKTLIQCPWAMAHCGVADNSDTTNCCTPESCQAEAAQAPKQSVSATNEPIDPDCQIVYRVEGLTCPAVKGIGCGNLLAPMLQRLDKIEGVEGSSANYTGTMIRIAVNKTTDRDKVAEEVRKALAANNSVPLLLVGDDLGRALAGEQWRETKRIWELSAIEFRTLVPQRIKTFAKAEKLDRAATDKLLKIAGELLDRIERDSDNEKATQPAAWLERCRKSLLPTFLERASDVLTTDQIERFKIMAAGQRRDEDRPEAPLAPPKGGKAP